MNRLLLLVAITIAPSAMAQSYRPTSLQLLVDRSFSATEIETPLRKVRNQLKEERINSCHKGDGCNWFDRNKVRHYFWGDGPSDLRVVVKSVRASDFHNRSIPALGIGKARTKAQALAAARKFAPALKFDCYGDSKTGKADAISYCSATMNPGWVTFEFDRRDRLTEVRLDGYHFT